MNGAYPMDGMGSRRGGGGDDQLERDLRSWLRSLDPGELPMAARLRLDSDLHAAAEWRSRRRWLSTIQPAVTAVVVVLAAVTAAMVIWGSHSAASLTGAPALSDPASFITPGDETGTPGPDYLAPMVLLALSTLAGCLVLVPRVRSAFSRGAFSASAERTDDVLPLPRSWRSVSPLVPVLGALAIVAGVAYFESKVGYFNSLGMPDLDRVDLTIQAGLQVPILLLLTVAVPLRYRIASGWTRLLMAGMSTSLVFACLVLLVPVVNQQPSYWLIVEAVSTLGLVATAAGLTRGSGRVPGPPLALAAIGIGLVFAVTVASVLAYAPFPYGLDRLDYVPHYLMGWLGHVAWLVILWTGWANRRRRPSPLPWRLLALAGACAVGSLIPQFADPILFWFNVTGLPDWFGYVLRWWQVYLGVAGSLALVAAVLLGIRPRSNPLAPPES